MKILMGTANKGKIAGAKRAFERYFDDVEITGIAVDSEVSDEPTNEEIEKGVQNRIKNLKIYAKENNLEADFYIASEAGLFNTFGRWMDTNFAMIEDSNGFQSSGISAGFPIARNYVDEILNTEMKVVFEKLFSEKDINQKGGGINCLTDEVITRIDLTDQAFTMALIEHRKKDFWN